MDIHPTRLIPFPIFKGVPPAEIKLLIQAGRSVKRSRGEILFHEGDRATGAFLIVTGRLGVYLGTGVGERLIGEGRPGDVLGEAGLLDAAARRNAMVKAMTDVELLEIMPETVEAMGENRAMVAIELYLLGAMARRIRSANARLEEALAPQRPPSEPVRAPSPPIASRAPNAEAPAAPKSETLTQSLLRILGGR